jgi:uncharacterized membrane protein
MAVIFSYGVVVDPISWYIVPIVILVFIGIFLQIKESEIRRYEADRSVEKAKIESQGKVDVEKERTNRQWISKGLDWFKKHF